MNRFRSKALAIVFVAFFSLQCQPTAAAQGRSAEAHRIVAAGGMLLDVRTREEFSAGHLPNAVNIPVNELGGRLSEVPSNRPVVVYCQRGTRSAAAAEILRNAGRTQVIELGAMSNW